MAVANMTSRLAPLVEEALDNRYARDELREGVEKLRDAYERTRKRRVKPSRDRKLRRQFEAAIAALDEGTAALVSGRKKPRRAGRKLVVTVLVVAGAGAGAALAFNEDLRNSVFSSAKNLTEEVSSGPAPEPTNHGGGA
jgi:hypothetical protein